MSATKKAPTSRRTRKTASKPQPIILDFEVRFAHHVTQNIALPYVGSKAIADWSYDDLMIAIDQAIELLPVATALSVSNVIWSNNTLHLTIWPDPNGYPHLAMDIRDFPQTAVLRVLQPDWFMVTAAWRDAKWPVRSAVTDKPCGVRLARSVMWDSYGNTDRPIDSDWLRDQEARQLAAIQAARRAADLPVLPDPRKSTGAR